MELRYSCWSAVKPGSARPAQEPDIDAHLAGWAGRGWSLSSHAVAETAYATQHHFIWARTVTGDPAGRA